MIGFLFVSCISSIHVSSMYVKVLGRRILEGLRIMVQLDLLKLLVRETFTELWVSGFWTRKVNSLSILFLAPFNVNSTTGKGNFPVPRAVKSSMDIQNS